MKRSIQLLLPAAALALSLYAGDVTSLSQIDNATVVSITRRPAEATDSCGYLCYVPTSDETSTKSLMTSSTLDDNALWVLYYNSADDNYFLYNIGAQLCLNTSSTASSLDETAIAVVPTYLSSMDSWTLASAGQMLGLSTGRRNAVYFLGDIDADGDNGFLLSIDRSDRQLSDDEAATMAMQVNATRNATIEQYRLLLEQYKALNADGMTNYCGTYDIADFEAALDNADTTPLCEIERLANAAVLSALPQAGAYYRIKNVERPVNNSLNNYMTLNANCKQLFVQSSTTLGLSNSSNNGENLRLFQFEPVEGAAATCYRIRQVASDLYLNRPGISSAVQLVDIASSAVFNLTRYDVEQRLFLLRYNSTTNVDLTSNGVNGGQTVVPYNVAERPQRWYIEKIDAITGPTLDDNGYAGMVVPCPVNLPLGVTAYCVDWVEGSTAYITPVEGTVAAYTPVIICGEANTTVELTIAEAGELATLAAEPVNLLQGVTAVTTPADESRYLLTVVDGATVLQKVESTASLSANTIYLPTDCVDSDATVLTLSTDHSTSGVDLPVVDGAAADCFDLLGRRVVNPAAGTVVVRSDGSKAIIK